MLTELYHHLKKRMTDIQNKGFGYDLKDEQCNRRETGGYKGNCGESWAFLPLKKQQLSR